MALHPQVRSLLRAMAADDAPPPADLAAERQEYLDATLRLGGAAEPVAGFEDVVVPSFDGARLPARVYAPLHATGTDALLVWLHGGGWYVGDIETFDRVARVLANASGARVLLPEYRLAPEHPWPTQTRDADAVVAWAQGEGAAQLGTDPARGDADIEGQGLLLYRHGRTDAPLAWVKVSDRKEFFRSILGKGWSDLEADYVWSLAKVAEINLPADPARGSLLRLDVGSFIPEDFFRQHLDVVVNGRPAGSWDFNHFEMRRQIRIDLGPDAGAAQRIELRIAHPASPSDYPSWPKDGRTLGVSLYGIHYETH